MHNHLEIIKPKELSRLIKASVHTIKRWEKMGQFPRHILLGERSIGWRVWEIDAWLRSKQTRRNEDDVEE